jgi:hypothetical protein
MTLRSLCAPYDEHLIGGGTFKAFGDVRGGSWGNAILGVAKCGCEYGSHD